MSDTTRKRKKANHKRFNLQVLKQTYEDLEGIAEQTGLSMSYHGREAISKYVKIHKMNRKGDE